MSAHWFKPKTLLDKTYEIGLFVKGFDGSIELIGGALVLLLSPQTILHLTKLLVQVVAFGNSANPLAHAILDSGHKLASGHTLFASLFLLAHGVVKVVLVVCLLLNKLWAYPYAIGILTLFLVYQIYILCTSPSIGMALLSLLDVAIIWLVWREWQQIRRSGQNLAEL